MKGSILRSHLLLKGASSLGRSGPSSVISDPTDPSLVSDPFRPLPPPSLASVTLSESQRSLLAFRPFRRSLALTSDAFLLQLQARAVELESMATRAGDSSEKNEHKSAGTARARVGRGRRLLKTRPEPQPSDADADADADAYADAYAETDADADADADGNLSLFGDEQPPGALEVDEVAAARLPLDDLLGLEWPEASSR